MFDQKEKFLELEANGNYVFHGSPNGNIEQLEPRQANHVPDLSRPTKTIPDGTPAVSATPYVELAIFRAIINNKNIPFSHTSGFGVDNNGNKEFIVSSKKVLEEAKNKKGFVYVFNKSDFKPYNRDGKEDKESMEWRSRKAVRPVKVLEVSYKDLPLKENIKINE